jgi:hypothetical protein
MRFSVRGLLIFVVIASVSLALTQAPFLIGCGLLVAAVIVANFLLPLRTWRHLAYGAVLGIISALLLLFILMDLTMTAPHSYMDGRIDMLAIARPYVIQIGALSGATLGFAYGKRRSTVREAPIAEPRVEQILE